MASFFGMANPIDDIKGAIIKGGVTEYIRSLEKKDIDNIFNNTDRTPAGHIQFFTGDEWKGLTPDQQKRTYAASNRIMTMHVAYANDNCDIKAVKSYFDDFDEQHEQYENREPDAIIDSLDRLMKDMEVKDMELGGGKKKKQTGGGVTEIVQLLAGMDVVVLAMLNNRGLDVKIIDGTINLLNKAAVAISALSGLPACMREIMGDTLYRIVERFTTSMVAYKAAEFTWQHKMALISVLGKMLSYAPDAAGLAISLIVGFAVTKVATGAASVVTSVDYEGNVKSALDALDTATPGDLAKVGTTGVTKTVELTKKFINLSVELVIKVRKQLADAHDENARKTVIAKADEEDELRKVWAGLLQTANPGKRARDENDEKEKLNKMFDNQFTAIRNAIRTSPEYIAAQQRRGRAAMSPSSAMGPGEKENPGAGASMGAAMSASSAMGPGEKENPGAGAMSENVDEQGAMEEGDENVQEEDDDEEHGAKKSRGALLAEEYEPFGFGGKRKSQKQQQKKQKQQKKTQKQSHKKLSKSKRAKKSKQSKKANKKH